MFDIIQDVLYYVAMKTRKEINKDYRQRHTEKIKAYEQTPDRKAKQKERSKKIWQENREYCLQKQAEWRKNNPEKNRLRHKLYHAKKAGFDNIEDYERAIVDRKEKRKAATIQKKQKEKEQNKLLRQQEKKQRFIDRIKNAEYIIDNNGCWNIQAKQDLNGYYLIGGYSAHREFYKYYKGEIPKGKIIRHSCDNPQCVNPDHLIIGTKKDNTQDMIERDRQVKRGNVIRLNEVQIEEIYLSNKTSYELAKIYPVTSTQIRRIKNGTRCSNITRHL
jgi:hypothetical protein